MSRRYDSRTTTFVSLRRLGACWGPAGIEGPCGRSLSLESSSLCGATPLWQRDSCSLLALLQLPRGGPCVRGGGVQREAQRAAAVTWLGCAAAAKHNRGPLQFCVQSPEGRIFQIEYAMEAISNAGSCVGVLATDGVVLAAEKKITSKVRHSS